ncbi:hypothetical protein, partial [Clostridium cuniculi]|uniref:hypothetical protein n=1 Tax=Clostridium cuniculi TaxID=2548455 RepID=UPI00311A9B1C
LTIFFLRLSSSLICNFSLAISSLKFFSNNNDLSFGSTLPNSLINFLYNCSINGNNIFVFRNNKNDYKEDSNINNKEEWNLKRHKALEKAKYKCEECGNITNLEVYTKEINNDEELIVLCKMCYEKNIGEIKLHYQ